MTVQGRNPGTFIMPAAAIAVYTLFALILYYPVTFHPGSSLPQPCDDPLLNCWILAWDIGHFCHGWPGYWNGPVFYPSTLTLAYSENLLGILPLALLFHAMTHNIIFVHNLLILCTFPLTGICMYLFCCRFFKNTTAAFFAGLFFAFAPYRTVHSFHLNLLSMYWIPLILLFWHDALEYRKWWSCPLMTGCIVLLCISCIHYGLFTLFIIPVLTVIYCLKKKEAQRGIMGVALAYMAAIAALIPINSIYSLVKKTLGIINLPSPLYSASITSYLTPWQHLNLWGWAHRIIGRGEGIETSLFPGLLIILASAFTVNRLTAGLKLPPQTGEKPSSLIHRISGLLLICLLILILSIAFSGGITITLAGLHISAFNGSIPTTIFLFFAAVYLATIPGFAARAASLFHAIPPHYTVLFTLLITGLLFSFYGPFLLLGKVAPPFFTMRVPARFFVLALLSLSMLAGLGVSAFIEERLTKGWKGIAYVLASCVVCAECLALPQSFIYMTPPVKGVVPVVYEKLKEDADSKVVAELPFFQTSLTSRYMMYSTYHGKNLVNGYSGILPRYMEDLSAVIDGIPSHNALLALRFFEVDSLILHKRFLDPGEGELISAALKKEKALTLLGDYQGSELYRVNRQELPDLDNREPASLPISREGWKVEAPSRGFRESVSSAVDGRVETYWTTGRNGQKGDTLLIDTVETHQINTLLLSLGTDFRTYPRAYSLEVSLNGADWQEVKREDESFPPFPSYFRNPANPGFFITFPPRPCRYLRLVLTKDSPQPFGAHEIDIY